MSSSISQPASLLLQLPHEILKHILSRLNQRDRLCSCSLACQQLHQAATAATDTLVLRRRQQPTAAPMTEAAAYLRRHGDFLTRLEVEGWGQPQEWLPCRNLRHLDISSGVTDGVLWLAPVRDALSCCTGLTHLGLKYVRFGCTEDAEVFAAHMTGLRELFVKASDVSWAGSQPPPFGPNVLPPLTRLTSLEWDVSGITDDSLRHLSSLTGLRSLCIRQAGHIDVTSAAFAGVTGLQQLQRLSLDLSTIDARAAPFFKSLTALQSLDLSETRQFDVAVLGSLTQLTELRWHGELWREGAEALLALLPKLQQLRLLALRSLVSTFEQFSAAAFTALTASSNLQQLELNFVEMPHGVWQHMFPSTMRMPQLTHVHIEGYAEMGEPASWAPPLSPTGLAGLVSCCPGLRTLELRSVPWGDGVRLTTLQQLSALTELDVAPDDILDTTDILRDIATLTQLVDLHIEGVAGSWVEMLVDLTTLQQLTRLSCVQHFQVERDPETWDNEEYFFENKAPFGCPPDVWSQLAEFCSAESESMSEDCCSDGAGVA